MIRFSFLILLLITNSVFADQRADLAQGKYWQRLLRYQSRFFGGHKSEAYNEKFFLSPVGRTNPLAELNTDVDAFLLPVESGKQHAQCRFPERYKFLKKELSLTATDIDCPEFKKWKAAIDARSFSLIFAAAFMNSPASIAGHTFLKVDRKTRGRSGEVSDLLDNVINYAAATGDDAGFKYMFKGMTGGFNGEFMVTFYYDTIQIYRNIEQRDLWEYKLNLTDEQIERLLGNLWEIQQASFQYYFFDENCSYHLLALLEVANPDWDLTSQLGIIVNPADAVKAVSRTKGAVSEVRARPSQHKQLMARLQTLDVSDRNLFEARFKNPLPLFGTESTRLLDAYIDYENYRDLREKRKKDFGNHPDFSVVGVAGQYHELLVARTKRGESAVEPPLPETSGRPDESHEMSKISASYGLKGEQNFTGFSWRAAGHDILDSDHGYLPLSQIELLKTEVHWIEPQKKFKLRSFKLIDAMAFNSTDVINRDSSWSMAMGIRSPTDFECGNCNVGFLSGGIGSSKGKLLYLLKMNVETGGVFKYGARFGPSAFVGLLLDLSKKVRIFPQTEFFYHPTEKGKAYFLKSGLHSSIDLSRRLNLRLGSDLVLGPARNVVDSRAELGWYY